MTQSSDAGNAAALQQPPPLRVSRTFHARRELVFKAWCAAEHVRNWFSPRTYSVADATVEMRVGGAFDVCMLSPSGERHWTRGKFVEVTPHSRLVIDMHATDLQGRKLFRAYTEVTFTDAVAGATTMDVVQTYTFVDPAMAAPMVAGAAEGWRTTLDKLDQELLRLSGAVGTHTRSVVHASFHLERHYDAPVARVWRALTEQAAKEKWFVGPPGEWELVERRMDVREAGASWRRDASEAAWSPRSTPATTTSSAMSGWSTAMSCIWTTRRYPFHWQPCSSGARTAGRGSWSPNRAPFSTATTMQAHASTAPRICSTRWAHR
jgi:uncharacterized protein YndB with AHSA1/START domain